MNKNACNINSTCLRCVSSTNCITVGLSESEIRQLDKVVQAQKVLHKGDYLFYENDKFDCLYAVRSGSFKTVVHEKTEQEQIKNFYFAGGLIGLGAIADEKYHYSAIALETSSICAGNRNT